MAQRRHGREDNADDCSNDHAANWANVDPGSFAECDDEREAVSLHQ